jgi:hypothetical protein
MIKSQRGSATVEVFVVSLVAIPLLIAVPLLGKQLDAKHQTNMAARYAAWERTVWSDSGSSWRNAERSKSDADITMEINDRFYGHRQAELVDVSRSRSEGITSDPIWRDRRAQSLLANAGQGMPSTSSVTEGSPPVSHGILVTELASVGRSGGFLSGFSKSIGLNTNNYATAHVELPWKAEFPSNNVLEFPLQADSAILSDAWSPSDESRFHGRVAGLTIDDELRVSEVGTYTFGYLPIYKEGEFGQNADLVPSSSVVPSRFVR